MFIYVSEMNNYQEEENIRPPDEIKTEALLEDNRSDYDKQLEEAIYVSMQEIRQQQEIHQQFEEQLLKEFTEEIERRKEEFHPFMANIVKLCRYDPEVKDVYDIIEPIVESYCNQRVETCELDEETYDKIFKTLNKIRNDKHGLDLLKTIIVKPSL